MICVRVQVTTFHSIEEAQKFRNMAFSLPFNHFRTETSVFAVHTKTLGFSNNSTLQSVFKSVFNTIPAIFGGDDHRFLIVQFTRGLVLSPGYPIDEIDDR